ncbi:hypothetical protein [Bdellovibrio sp. HCB337]|uniref:hypothetical protein n=1 Tax=Bdellovibrio sp. HCB337 TaxID=3394358 RepID=UPI0039A58D63
MKTSIFLNVSLFVLATLTAAATYAQTTRVLTFDDIAAGSSLTTQYQSVGVTAAGATILDFAPWLPKSGANLAFAPEGLMEFAFNSSITGNIRTVSAYVSGVPGTGIFAYDSAGNQVGQSVLSANGANVLLSVTSSTNPIARVQIHDGGATFGVDDFTFVSEPSIPMCVASNRNLYSLINALPSSAYKTAKTVSVVKAAILKQLSCLDQALLSDVSNKQLLAQLTLIKASVDAALKSSTQKTQIMNIINQLIASTKAGQC